MDDVLVTLIDNDDTILVTLAETGFTGSTGAQGLSPILRMDYRGLTAAPLVASSGHPITVLNSPGAGLRALGGGLAQGRGVSGNPSALATYLQAQPTGDRDRVVYARCTLRWPSAGNTDGTVPNGSLTYNSGICLIGWDHPYDLVTPPQAQMHFAYTPGTWIMYVITAAGGITIVANGYTDVPVVDGPDQVLEVWIDNDTTYARLPNGTVVSGTHPLMKSVGSWAVMEMMSQNRTTDLVPTVLDATFGNASASGPRGKDATFTGQETIVALGNKTGAFNIDLSTGTVFSFTLTGDCAVTFINTPPAGKTAQATLLCKQDSSATARALTITGQTNSYGARVLLSTAPNALDEVACRSYDQGASWLTSLTAAQIS